MKKLQKLVMLNVKLKLSSFIATFINRNDTKKRAGWKTIGMLLLILFLVLELGGMYVFMLISVIQPLIMLGQPEVLFTLVFIIAQILTLIFGFISMLSNMFFARDNEFMLSLPVKTNIVFLSKFSVVYLSELVLCAVLFIPAIIIYGINLTIPFDVYLRALLVLLFVPAVPLAVDAVLLMPMMRVVASMRKSNALKTAAAVFFTIALLFVSMNFGQIFGMMTVDSASLAESMGGIGSLAESVSRVFPPSLWATKGITASGMDGLLNLLLLVAASIVMLVIAGMLSSLLYRKSVAAQLETAKSKRQNRIDLHKYQTSTPMRAIFSKEWKVLLRTPTYIINGLISIIMGPMMIVIMASQAQFSILIHEIQGVGSPLYIGVILAFVMVFIAGMNTAVSTMVTREGKSFYITKIIPVPYKLQIKAKYYAGYLISILAAIVFAISLIAVGINWIAVLFGMILCLILCVSSCALSLLIDVRKPKLDWINPQQAMKQNLSSMVGVFLAWGIMGIFILLFVLLNGSGLPIEAVAGVICILGIACAVLSYRALLRYADRHYEEITM